MQIQPYNVPMQTISSLHLTFLLFDGFSNMVLASAIEPLRAACDLSGKRLFSWQIASVTGDPAHSSSRLHLNADLPLNKVGATDALIVISGYGIRDHLKRSTVQAVFQKSSGLSMIGGFDTGAWMLAESGLLTGRRATIHWMEVDQFAEAYPEIDLISAAYTSDGRTVTCSGAQGALSWGLDLIGRQADEALRYDVANMFDRTNIDPTDPDWRSMSNRALPANLQRAILAMRETAETPLALNGIAERAAMSARTLDRMFHKHLGMSSGAYYRLIRLSYARSMATETNLTLDEIAARIGFASAATLARAYRQHFGETIRQTRQG